MVLALVFQLLFHIFIFCHTSFIFYAIKQRNKARVNILLCNHEERHQNKRKQNIGLSCMI